MKVRPIVEDAWPWRVRAPWRGCQWRSSRSVASLAGGMHRTTSALCGGSAVLSRVWAGRRRSRARRGGAKAWLAEGGAARRRRRRRGVDLEDVGEQLPGYKAVDGAGAGQCAAWLGYERLLAQWGCAGAWGTKAVLALRSAICNDRLDGFWQRATAPPLAVWARDCHQNGAHPDTDRSVARPARMCNCLRPLRPQAQG